MYRFEIPNKKVVFFVPVQKHTLRNYGIKATYRG